MLSDFLWASKQQRILAAFFMNPDWQFQLAELFEAAGGGRSSTQAYIEALVRAEMVNAVLDRRTGMPQTCATTMPYLRANFSNVSRNVFELTTLKDLLFRTIFFNSASALVSS